jgi:hypothetical protein
VRTRMHAPAQARTHAARTQGCLTARGWSGRSTSCSARTRRRCPRRAPRSRTGARVWAGMAGIPPLIAGIQESATPPPLPPSWIESPPSDNTCRCTI